MTDRNDATDRDLAVDALKAEIARLEALVREREDLIRGLRATIAHAEWTLAEVREGFLQALGHHERGS